MDANERRARAIDEATQWWNRLCLARPTEISKADREVFTQWLRESPLHVAEFLRIAHMHDALERFNLWGEIQPDYAATSHNVVSLRESNEATSEPLSGSSRAAGADEATQRSRAGFWAIAASACLVAILAAWFALGSRGQVLETQLAERRQVMLDDGSVVQIEPETKLRVRFEDRRRLVDLEHGRALFRVAKDAQRPFWVTTQQTSVRAVGTAFGVESSAQRVIVTVAEGAVAVGRNSGEPLGDGPIPAGGSAKESSGRGARATEILLTAGQQVTVQRSSGALDDVRTVDAARALAWAQGQLIFDNAALADVVVEFNRYNRTQLRLDDRQLATRPVSGVFEATDIETLLAFIRQGSSEIRINHTERGVIISSHSEPARDASTVQ